MFSEFGAPIEVGQVDDPTPGDGEVIVEVHANGICRSDWHGWMGHDQSIPLPHVPGHEMSGVVVELGHGVDQVSIGDRVTAPFVLGCGTCAMCAAGDHHVCLDQEQAGFTRWGSLAQYVAIPYADTNVVPLPEAMTYAAAAGLGCRFATAYRAVVDQGAVRSGSKVAVWGCGGVGLSAVMIAAELGAEVIAIDIDAAALAFATDLGATAVVDGSATDRPDRVVRELTDGGADVSIDALGSRTTMDSSIRSLRTRGRHIQVGLMIGDDAAPVVPMWRLHALEIELFGSHGMQAHRYSEMLDLVATGRLAPERLITEDTLDLAAGADLIMRMDTFPTTGFAVVTDFA